MRLTYKRGKRKRITKGRVSGRGNRFKKERDNKKGGILFLMILFFWAGAYSIAWCYNWLTTSVYFQVNHIEVDGLRHTKERDILDLIGSVGNNIFQINIDNIRERLERDPWIKEVSVRRELPDRIIVRVKERTAIAIFRTGDSLYLMDEEGVLLERVEKREDMPFPLIIGDRLPDSGIEGVGIIKNLCYGDDTHLIIDMRDKDDLMVYLKNYRVRMGKGRYNEKLKRFIEFEKRIMERRDRPQEIDMRFSGRVIVREM